MAPKARFVAWTPGCFAQQYSRAPLPLHGDDDRLAERMQAIWGRLDARGYSCDQRC